MSDPAVIRRAFAAAPHDRAARFAFASLLLDEGDVTGAAAAAAPLGSAAPDALWLGARVAAARHQPEAARAALDRLLALSLTPVQRAEALLARGVALDLLGDPAGAFAAAAEGKAIQRALHAGVAGAREGEVAKLARIGGWLRTAALAPAVTAPVPGEGAAHVFLLGFPRSGTTLLEQVLAAHPGVRTLEEAPTLAVAYQAFLSDAAACERLLTVGEEEAAAWAADYWRRVRALGVEPEGRVFVDKQPAGTLHLPLIARLFPRARILFALRDPRDVVLSCFRQPFALNAMTYAFTDLAETARCYDACMALADAARARLPLAWLDTRHEALVDDLPREVARIAALLELAPDPAMADFLATANARAIRTPSAAQVREGLSRRGLDRWRRYAGALAPVLPVLAPWVERWEYVE